MAIVTRAQCADYDKGWETTFGKKLPRSGGDDVPRRNRMDLMTPAELACLKAISIIETTTGCDERLTQAQILIGKAQELVADWVDGKQP